MPEWTPRGFTEFMSPDCQQIAATLSGLPAVECSSSADAKERFVVRYTTLQSADGTYLEADVTFRGLPAHADTSFENGIDTYFASVSLTVDG